MTIEYRNVSGHERLAQYGVVGSRITAADGILRVVDEAADSYDCQPTIWEPVDQAGFAARQDARERAAAPAVEPQTAEPVAEPEPPAPPEPPVEPVP